MDRREYSKARRRLIGWVAVCVGLRVFAALQPAAVEALYARGLYPPLGAALAGASSLVPFSLAEAATALMLALVGAWLVRGAWRALRRRRSGAAPGLPPGHVGRLRARGVRALAAGALAYLLFLLVWGLHYGRPPAARLLGLDPSPAALDELQALCRELLADAAALRAGRPEDAAGALRLADGARGALRRAPAGFERLAAARPLFAGSTAAPKPLLTSRLFSWLGIVGLYFPFTGEAHVNVDAPHAGQPFAACHELAHARGFAREDEASFVGYLACRAHPDADFRYSAAFEALGEALHALRQAAPEAAQQIAGGAPPEVRRDWAAQNDWLRRHAGPAREASHAVNDAYLRAHGQSEGVRSYGRVVDLLLAERRARVAGTGLDGLGSVAPVPR